MYGLSPQFFSTLTLAPVKEPRRYRIKVLVPIVNNDPSFHQAIIHECSSVQPPDFDYDYEYITHGTTSIESRWAEFVNTENILEICTRAQEDGFDGVFISCFGDPGVDVAREVLTIPIVGGFEGAALMATNLSKKWSIITITDTVIEMLWDLAKSMGLQSQLVSVLEIDTPVLELNNETILVEKLTRYSIKAIDEDGAEAVCLGCTAMMGAVEKVRNNLKNLGPTYDIPVLAPAQCSLTLLESYIRMGLSQSKKTWFFPPNYPNIV